MSEISGSGAGHDATVVLVSNLLPEQGVTDRDHVLDETCWCEPTVDQTGAGTVIHHKQEA